MPPIMRSESMTLLDVTILTAALVNLVFSLTVYLHSRRKLVETIFAVFALSVSLWSLATFLMTSRTVSFEVFQVGAKLHYISGNLVFWSLFWFSVFYPSRKNHSLFLPVALSTANAIILILVLSTGFLFESFANTSVLAERIIFNTAGYVVLSLVTISMFGLSQLFLVRKYRLAEGDERTQIGGIILATSIAGSLGLVTNLFLPGFGNFSLFYLGPIITTPLFVGVMVYAILKYKLFNLRVITAEIFTALLMIALAVELFLSNTVVAVGARGLVFLAAGVFGFFLIKSVYREIRAREEIERLNQTMSEFLAIATHQIRTPLTHVKTALSLIRNGDYGPVDSRALPLINQVYLSTGRLIGLVNDLLDMSRMDSGRLQYVFGDVDLNDLVDSVVTEFKIAAADRGITIDWSKAKASVVVWGDQEKLRQVVFNLIDNALKYTQRGTVEIKVESNSGAIELSVKDSGVGMSKETIDRLFKKFSRGATTQQPKTQGTGLGLYVAKRIIDDHKGELWAQSEGEGKGSIFHLRLVTKSPTTKTEEESPANDAHLAKAA